MFVLSEILSYDAAVLTVLLSVFTHGVALSRIKPGRKALVYAAGTIGLLAVVALQK
ncbi:MAG: hypothetical protein LUG60_07745 [Erysipelotrichaceae bacterium]|nr:hypothetical protein [Erysipelotrichaceae bacterium]